MNKDHRTLEKDHRFGTKVAGYELRERIGQGGMGMVYRALPVDGGDFVALKLMLDELALDVTFRERFIREAQLVPTIDHPNIVPILDSGQDGDSLFIVMKLIEGPDLKSLIRERGPLELRTVRTVISQVGAALDAAHESGLVHRDIKAQNILIDESGDQLRAYVTDFGLMKPVASETSISRTGQIFGSVPYMPPELIEGLPSDGRVDVYALGCVLFECLTGSVPFTRANEVAMLWAHIHEDPPRPSGLRPELPGGIDDVIVRALQKHPDDRYLTCGELYDDLVASMTRRKSLTYGKRSRLLVARARRAKGPREVWAPNFFPELARVDSARRRIDWRRAALAAFTFTFPLASIVHVASPDGLPSAMADVASAGTTFVGDLFGADPSQKVRASGETTSIESPAAGIPEPSSRRSRSETGASVPEIGPEILPEPPVEDTEVLDSHIASSGGRARIFFTRNVDGNTEIFSIAPDGSQEVNLSRDRASDVQPAISPDGRKIAFWSNRVRGQGDLYVMPSSGGPARRVTPDSTYDSDPSWSPDGRWLVYASFPEAGCATPSCVGGWQFGDGDIRAVRLKGLRVRTLVSLRNNSSPDWSPDGKRIVFVRDGDLFTMEMDGSGFKQLTNTPANESQPRWSPDGKLVVYASLGGVFVIPASGGAGVQVTDLGLGAESPAWSPTGKRIVYSACASVDNCSRRLLWTIGVDGQKPFRVSPASGNDYFADWGYLR